MFAYRFVSAFALVLAVSGCATKPSAPTTRSAIGCDEAVAQATAFGRGSAQAIAINSLKHQLADVRGYLISQGYRHVRPADRTISCRAHPFGGGLVQCTVVHRYCGR